MGTWESLFIILFIFMLNHVCILTAENDIGCRGGKDVDVLELCSAGSLTTSSFLLSAYSAKGMNYQSCECSVFVIGGNRLTMSPVSQPGYQGCGSEIQVKRNDQMDASQVIRCQGGTTHTGLIAGNTLSFSLYLTNIPYDTSYCYRLDIEGTAPSMKITCDEAVTVPTTASDNGTVEVTAVKSPDGLTKNVKDRCDSIKETEIWLYPLFAFVCLYGVLVTVGWILKEILSSALYENKDSEGIPSRTPSMLNKLKAKRSTVMSRLSSSSLSSKTTQPATITENNFELEAQYCENTNSATNGESAMCSHGASNPSHWNMTYAENEEQNSTDEAVYSCIAECK